MTEEALRNRRNENYKLRQHAVTKTGVSGFPNRTGESENGKNDGNRPQTDKIRQQAANE